MKKVAIKGYLYDHPMFSNGDDNFEMEEMSDGTWIIRVDGDDIGEFQVIEEGDAS